jgi:hypothetical protein
MPPKTAGRTNIKVKEQVGTKVAELLVEAVPLIPDDILLAALGNAWANNAASECSTVLRVRQTAYVLELAATEVQDEHPSLANQLENAAEKLRYADEHREACGT